MPLRGICDSVSPDHSHCSGSVSPFWQRWTGPSGGRTSLTVPTEMSRRGNKEPLGTHVLVKSSVFVKKAAA